jgi:translocator protein
MVFRSSAARAGFRRDAAQDRLRGGGFEEDKMKNMKQMGMLLLSIAICFAVSGLGALFTRQSVSQWYPVLLKPAWNPPAWVFGPVWSTLYLMMAIAAWLVWRERGFKAGAGALGLFALQLAFNAAWSPLFFGLRSPLAGLIDIIPMWAAILATAIAFWRISWPAGALLIPYWLWVSFATALNFAIWRLNR